MGNSEESWEHPLLEDSLSNKGGFRVVRFIIVSMALQTTANLGLMANISLYLVNEYQMELKSASNVMFLWSSLTSIIPIFGAVVADSFLGRFYTIGFGFLVSLLGLVLLWLTALVPQARPLPCDRIRTNGICEGATLWQFMYLYSSFGLIAVGAGATKSCFLAFGANQLQQKGEFERRPDVKRKYFVSYYAAEALSALISLVCIVYIQDKFGWGMQFAVCAVLVLCGGACFLVASPFYVKLKSKSSLLTGLAQVAVASFRNRDLNLSDSGSYAYHCKERATPSRRLMFLNKACVIRDSEEDLRVDGEAKDPWRLCTVEAVEELKGLIRVIPIWSTGMIMVIDQNQGTFPLVQATSMDRQITPSFTIPAASFNTFLIIAGIVWVVVFDRVFLYFASRDRGSQARISSKTRMGTGIFLSFLAMMVSSVTEAIRRFLATGNGPIHMSGLWLIPQYCLNGCAEISNGLGQSDFYFSEFPQSMSSIAMSLMGIESAVGSLAASFIMNTIDKATNAGGKESWISNDINKGHYDYYYLVLAGLSAANTLYFLACSAAYGPLKNHQRLAEEEGLLSH